MDPETTTPPSPDERALAMLAHVLQLFCWFVAPLLIYLTRRDSRFVAFHASQALIWQGFLSVAVITPVLMWQVLMSATMTTNPEIHAQVSPPAWFLVVSSLMWLCWGALPVITLIFAIRYGIKAYHGEWAAYPIIGRWARQLALK